MTAKKNLAHIINIFQMVIVACRFNASDELPHAQPYHIARKYCVLTLVLHVAGDDLHIVEEAIWCYITSQNSDRKLIQ